VFTKQKCPRKQIDQYEVPPVSVRMQSCALLHDTNKWNKPIFVTTNTLALFGISLLM